MKFKMVFVIVMQILISVSLNVFSKNYYLYVYTENKKLKPNLGIPGTSNDEALNQIFKEFEVVSYYQSFPGAKTFELRHFYEIHFKGDVDSFEKLLNEKKLFEQIHRSDYYEPATCTNPATINDPIAANDHALRLLNARCAWTITRGSPNVIVAVVDTEFDTLHPDLRGKFVGLAGIRRPIRNHGTAVSSVIAANTNNNVGMAAIGYNTRLKGFHVDSIGTNTNQTLWNGIWSAYLEGIKIINVSWSGIGSYPNVQAVREMTSNGVVLVTAAGNIIPDHMNSHSLYADIPGVINVSSVDIYNEHGYTGFVHNPWVDVCALALDVIVCTPGNNGYGTTEGTSLAAPQVAGVVALMRAVNPNLTPPRIENMIKATAVTIADAWLFPDKLGAGRVDAYGAVALASGCASLSPVTITGSINTNQTINGSNVSIHNANVNIVRNNNLKINACTAVNITDNFTVPAGARLEINVFSP